jgi:hypothetical protein
VIISEIWSEMSFSSDVFGSVLVKTSYYFICVAALR